MNAEEFIYQVLKAKKEGLLLSVLSNFLSGQFKTLSIDDAKDFILQMHRDGKLITKPRVFRTNEHDDGDILLALPDNSPCPMPGDMNPALNKKR